MTKHGYDAHGNKILNNGMTGEQIENKCILRNYILSKIEAYG